ncbi:MAG: hypothetical protein QOD26_1689 [Betaproteobacteria bacterium]|jgi:phenylpyruvate tautomerase PptA (4-oxalocrotonate tautomerase family)|nr:hypothetical protein [Betaproteobacteria bacterium]
MPDVLIEAKAGWIGSKRKQLVDAVQRALVASLKVPLEDKVIRLVEHAPENFATPEGLGDKFTRIEIALFSGRSLDAKRALYREIVQALDPFGVPPIAVKVVLVEVPKQNVGFRGGKAACDVDIGYETAV